MDIISLPHHVIQRIFDFLSPDDVYWRRCVCKTLHYEAMEWLIKCPVIDACQSVARLIGIDENPLFERSSNLNGITEEEVIIRNREMNKGAHSIGRYIGPLAWWYFKRKTKFQHLPRPDIDKALESFLKEGSNCLPSFTFVRLDIDFGHLIHQIPFKHPTIGLQKSVLLDLKPKDEIFSTSLHTLMGVPEKFHLSERVMPYIEPTMEAFHINRFASDHKVILTNWSDPESIKPNLDDPEYPVKVFLYLVDCENGLDEHEDILEFVEESNFTTMGGFILEESIFYINPSESGQYRQFSAVSIAFSGKEIRSAKKVFKNLNEPEFLSEVTKFKNSLDFRTDDGKVLGFLIVPPIKWQDIAFQEYADKMMETFEHVKFVNLEMRIAEEWSDDEIAIVLLIRV